MKTARTALILTVAAFALVGGQAVAAATHTASLKTVTVAMHDPGCHWFAVGGRFTKTLSVKGPVALANFDENTLKVVGPNGSKLDRVGKKIVLAPGTYRITMVGQALDDNHLKLVVS